MARILAGTCGFAYRDWRGPFYPAGLPASRMLAAYAARLPTVEIDSTFYHPPDPATLAGWYRAVPRGFVLALKAPREITHDRRLVGIADAVRELQLAALCVAEAARGDTRVVATGRFGYLRLWRPDHDRRSLAAWVGRIAAQPWDEAFVYFRSAAAARAPALALALARIARELGERAGAPGVGPPR